MNGIDSHLNRLNRAAISIINKIMLNPHARTYVENFRVYLENEIGGPVSTSDAVVVADGLAMDGLLTRHIAYVHPTTMVTIASSQYGVNGFDNGHQFTFHNEDGEEETILMQNCLQMKFYHRVYPFGYLKSFVNKEQLFVTNLPSSHYLMQEIGSVEAQVVWLTETSDNKPVVSYVGRNDEEYLHHIIERSQSGIRLTPFSPTAIVHHSKDAPLHFSGL